MEVEVHSQAILRVVDETEETVTEDEYLEAEADQAEYAADVADGEVTSISDDRAAADTATDKTEPGDKPQA
ncbi:hypothetical protein [Pseudoxanthomonas mexicana]